MKYRFIEFVRPLQIDDPPKPVVQRLENVDGDETNEGIVMGDLLVPWGMIAVRRIMPPEPMEWEPSIAQLQAGDQQSALAAALAPRRRGRPPKVKPSE